MRRREPHCPGAGRHLHTANATPDLRAVHDAQAVRLAYQRHGLPMHGAAAFGEPPEPHFPCLTRPSHGTSSSFARCRRNGVTGLDMVRHASKKKMESLFRNWALSDCSMAMCAIT